MQLAKTMAALERLRSMGVPYVSVMSDPTTGGVFASYAAMGDVNLAEPNALIGFAGARVGAGTIGQELPPGFQRSEFLFRHGFVDRVVARGGPEAGARADPPLPRAATPGGDRWLTASSAARGEPGSRDGGAAGARRARDRRAADGPPGRGLVARPARAQPAPPPHPRAARGHGRRRRRAPRRPRLRRRRGDRGRVRDDRRTQGGGRRPAEGRRHRGERPAQLRHAPPRGLPQGDADHGARRAGRAAGRDVRRRARRAPGPGVRGARASPRRSRGRSAS